MKFFSYALVYAFLAFVFYGLISFIRFAYVRIKAYIIRRKLSNLSETETNKLLRVGFCTIGFVLSFIESNFIPLNSVDCAIRSISAFIA